MCGEKNKFPNPTVLFFRDFFVGWWVTLGGDVRWFQYYNQVIFFHPTPIRPKLVHHQNTLALEVRASF